MSHIIKRIKRKNVKKLQAFFSGPPGVSEGTFSLAVWEKSTSEISRLEDFF
jgi:hypothetical protein